jgi:Na+/serine symporter
MTLTISNVRMRIVETNGQGIKFDEAILLVLLVSLAICGLH